MARFKDWSSALLLVGVLLGQGCGGGVRFVPEQEGGVVLYMYNSSRGPRVTPRRDEAFQLMVKACPKGYRIIQEGEAPDRKREVEGMGGSEVVVQKWWGIRFRCLGGKNENK